MALKTKLENLIQQRGQITSYEMEEFCKKEGYKISNGERRLRESTFIEPEYKNGSIIAYKWKGIPERQKVCCASYILLSFHDQQCLKSQDKQGVLL